jgi:hypothetical protein
MNQNIENQSKAIENKCKAILTLTTDLDQNKGGAWYKWIGILLMLT